MRRIALVLAPALCTMAIGCAKPVAPTLPAPAPPKGQTPAIPVIISPSSGKPLPPVTTVEHCPTRAEVRRLRAARPKPLRNQPMPASPAERVARTSAQLGQYEARGAWADKVEEALARCDP